MNEMLWKKVQEAGWAAYKIGKLLGIRTEKVKVAGLDRPQKKEAWFARLAQMARNQGKGE